MWLADRRAQWVYPVLTVMILVVILFLTAVLHPGHLHRLPLHRFVYSSFIQFFFYGWIKRFVSNRNYCVGQQEKPFILFLTWGWHSGHSGSNLTRSCCSEFQESYKSHKNFQCWRLFAFAPRSGFIIFDWLLYTAKITWYWWIVAIVTFSTAGSFMKLS